MALLPSSVGRAGQEWQIGFDGELLLFAALQRDFMMERPNLQRAKKPQCAFERKHTVSSKPHQKYTSLDVNDPGMMEALMEGAVCNHIQEEHQAIEGNVFVMGEGRDARVLLQNGQKILLTRFEVCRKGIGKVRPACTKEANSLKEEKQVLHVMYYLWKQLPHAGR